MGLRSPHCVKPCGDPGKDEINKKRIPGAALLCGIGAKE